MIEPYYDEDGITIYNADCREVLPYLEPVDLVLTDPPYGVAYETAWRSRSDKLRAKVVNDETLDCLNQKGQGFVRYIIPQCTHIQACKSDST